LYNILPAIRIIDNSLIKVCILLSLTSINVLIE